MAISFTTAPVPEVTVGRKAEENPFTAPLTELLSDVDADGRSKHSITATVPAEDVSKLVGQAQRAGADLGVTVRKMVNDTDAKPGEAILTLWIVPRITRPRKAKGEDVAAE